ncbi:hypothetical protein CZ787_08400 [Halomonas citrativorans]|uniref:Uncharacterized protein n=1 Tax=Halomonas citrativorans TaxID=2742612 RepID=A0A1R4HYE3_9GAMM|nr:hypothetical protein CZ787_08400 [Halomonas citrativorans]
MGTLGFRTYQLRVRTSVVVSVRLFLVAACIPRITLSYWETLIEQLE